MAENNGLETSIEETKHLLKKHAKNATPIENNISSILASIQNLQKIAETEEWLKNRVTELLVSKKIDDLCYVAGPQYYLNIIKNPQYWENSTQKMREVEDAVKKLDTQMRRHVENINENSIGLKAKIAIQGI